MVNEIDLKFYLQLFSLYLFHEDTAKTLWGKTVLLENCSNQKVKFVPNIFFSRINLIPAFKIRWEVDSYCCFL